MVRESMFNIINLVRELINDPLDPESQFNDEEIQARLDMTREWVVEELTPLPLPDGSATKWQAQRKYWETDLRLSDPAGTAIEPITSDPNSGYFEFPESQGAVTATGFCYDVYAASAELLTLWAGRIEQDITEFSADGSSYKFTGAANAKLALAERYRAKSLAIGGIKTIRMVRDDHAY